MDYSKMSDFEINKSVAIALDIDMHFYIPESEDDFQPGFLPTELGPIWQTSAGFVGEFTVSNGNVFNPCNDPAYAWPIILSAKIGLTPPMHDDNWEAMTFDRGGYVNKNEYDSNPLRAAMIVFLMMQDSANVPANSTGSDIR